MHKEEMPPEKKEFIKAMIIVIVIVSGLMGLLLYTIISIQ